MMKAKAEFKYVRICPRKLARVVDTVRGLPAEQAINLLKFMPQKGARVLEKAVKSAVANAVTNHKLAKEQLVLVEAYVNKGIVLKRWKAKSRGRVGPILKRTSHLTVLVGPALWQNKEEA